MGADLTTSPGNLSIPYAIFPLTKEGKEMGKIRFLIELFCVL